MLAITSTAQLFHKQAHGLSPAGLQSRTFTDETGDRWTSRLQATEEWRELLICCGLFGDIFRIVSMTEWLVIKETGLEERWATIWIARPNQEKKSVGRSLYKQNQASYSYASLIIILVTIQSQIVIKKTEGIKRQRHAWQKHFETRGFLSSAYNDLQKYFPVPKPTSNEAK
jgi:hypothetical protein